MLGLEVEMEQGSGDEGVEWRGERSLGSAGAQNQDLMVEGPVPFEGFPLYASSLWGLVGAQPELKSAATLLLKVSLECPWLWIKVETLRLMF